MGLTRTTFLSLYRYLIGKYSLTQNVENRFVSYRVVAASSKVFRQMSESQKGPSVGGCLREEASQPVFLISYTRHLNAFWI